MKILIILFVLSTFLYFIQIEADNMKEYNVWIYIKGISFILMIITFIAIIIKW